MIHSAVQNRLIDNSSEELSMLSCLRSCIVAADIDEICIATGYWDVPGMTLLVDELRSFLAREDTTLKLLIGKDPYVYASLQEKGKYRGREYPEGFIALDLQELELREEYMRTISLLRDYLPSQSGASAGKLQVRFYPEKGSGGEQFLHAKCYIFKGRSRSLGIIGSSNFTRGGLLGNSELNYLETDATHVVARPVEGSSVKGHLYWFEEKWEQSAEWTQHFLQRVINPSPIAQRVERDEQRPFTPYELYIKLLHLQFGEVVDNVLSQQIASYFPAAIKQYSYQIDAVKRCIGIMHEHGGFMLGDVVGLGKTVVATTIIKYFLSTPQKDGRKQKVLVLSPPSLVSVWEDMIRLFFGGKHPKGIDILSTGRLDTLFSDDESFEVGDRYADFHEALPRKQYGLIVIDESHRFRNGNTQMYHDLDALIQDISSATGFVPYVGLLSATPQNNRPDDLKHQIYLFERDRNHSTLKKAKGGDLESFFSEINRRFTELTRSTPSPLSEAEKQQQRAALEELFQELRASILVDILERRTRTDLRQYYAEDMASQGLVFPTIVGPCNIHYTMDMDLARLFADTMDLIAPSAEEKQPGLGYYRYRAIGFLLPEYQSRHVGRGNRQASEVSFELAKLMQTLLVKRLESSITAFKASLCNLLRYTQCMIAMWENDTIFICPDLNVNKELDWEAKSALRGRAISFAECVDELRDKLRQRNERGGNGRERNVEYRRAAFDASYYQRLREDERQISALCARWSQHHSDPKLDTFKAHLKSELFDREKNTSGKLVIFSEAIVTVESLAREVEAAGYRVLVITAANRKEKEVEVRANFDANTPRCRWEDRYDVLITTEVLSEGVNLHRANVIVNYDTPWNATRLMQRIGRVNRIGSLEPAVYVYNFMPSAKGDAQIALVRRAYTKLQSFHVLFGEDNKIFSEEERLVHYALDVPTTHEAEAALQKLVDGEASELGGYIDELKQYRAQHPYRYTQIVKAHGIQLAQRGDGSAYFVLKASGRARLAFKVAPVAGDATPRVQSISLLDLLRELRIEEKASAVALPANWDRLVALAIKGYRQYFVHIDKSLKPANRLALTSIVEWYATVGLSEDSKRILEGARKGVTLGNTDIIGKILSIREAIKPLALPSTGAHLDALLAQHLAKLVGSLPDEGGMGEVSVELGIIK